MWMDLGACIYTGTDRAGGGRGGHLRESGEHLFCFGNIVYERYDEYTYTHAMHVQAGRHIYSRHTRLQQVEVEP